MRTGAMTVSMVAVVLAAAGCRGQQEEQREEDAKMKLTSSAFRNEERIPEKHTGDGADVSPPLSWTDPPEETAAFVLICDDPDAPAGTWVHWVLYDVPPDIRALPEGASPRDAELRGAKQGRNSFRKLDYGGPAPPPGKPHRYFFKLYAVDRPTGLKEGATKESVMQAVDGHVLAAGELMGTYSR